MRPICGSGDDGVDTRPRMETDMYPTTHDLAESLNADRMRHSERLRFEEAAVEPAGSRRWRLRVELPTPTWLKPRHAAATPGGETPTWTG